MSTLRKRIAAPIAIALALAITPALSGCFGNPLDNLVDQATGGDVDLGGGSLPKDFPAADVPLASGDITYSLALGNGEKRVWSVIVAVDSLGAIDDITAQLEGAGFNKEDTFAGDSSDGATRVFKNDEFTVLVIVTKDGEGGFAASYTVTPTPAE